MYEKGNGVEPDYAQAFEWYRKAAEQGFAQGQLNLALMYQKGRGAPQDNAAAFFWFNLAASNTVDLSAAAVRDMALKLRDQLKPEITPAQFDEAQRMAGEWTQRHPPND
jgi:TPR repeat protein